MTELVSATAQADLRALVREWCRTQAHPTTLEQAEQVALAVGQVVAECVFEEAVEACGTRVGYGGPKCACAGGEAARFVGYRRRWVRGQPGEGAVTRAYYQCRACGKGQCPWDQEQGLDQHTLTPLLKTRGADLCGRLVFREAQEVLHQFTGLSLAVSLLEEVTEQVGGRVRAAEDAQVQGLFAEGRLPPADPFLAQVREKRGYLCVDAAKAHTDGSWHDVKVATLFPGVPPAAGCGGRDTAGAARYLAIQEAAEPFGRRLYTFALDAVQILDFFHASEHVWKIARAVFGEESPVGQQWAATGTEALREEGVPGLLRGLRALRKQALTPTAQAVIREEVRYFRRNRCRMAYPRYRKAGMMIGSGPVEAACKSVVGSRLKGPGMRWSQEGAAAVLAIRTAILGREYGKLALAARAA